MNYGTLKTLAQQYLENSETSFVDNLPVMIRAAEEAIFRDVQLPDLMQTASADAIPGSLFLPLPADFLAPYSLAVRAGGELRMLVSKDYSFLREAFPDDTVDGVPRYYAVYNDSTIILGPVPDNPYTVELNYFYEPVSLTAGDDDGTTWLSVNAENALLFGTLLQGYIYSKGDQDVMAQYQSQYDTAMTSLKILAEGRNRKDAYRQSDRRIPT